VPEDRVVGQEGTFQCRCGTRSGTGPTALAQASVDVHHRPIRSDDGENRLNGTGIHAQAASDESIRPSRATCGMMGRRGRRGRGTVEYRAWRHPVYLLVEVGISSIFDDPRVARQP
jgi:hypothetical protein